MKEITFRLGLMGAAFALCSCGNPSTDAPLPTTAPIQKTEQVPTRMSLYDFQVNAIDGSPFDLSALQGKKVLLVNTASECGLTPQYSQLQELHEAYAGDEFVILGFPANNFGAQEPGSNQDIAAFCQANYGVGFQMMEKISVLGDDMHPLYAWLTSQTETEVVWNFQKFLISPDGSVLQSVAPNVEPADEVITNWIQS